MKTDLHRALRNRALRNILVEALVETLHHPSGKSVGPIAEWTKNRLDDLLAGMQRSVPLSELPDDLPPRTRRGTPRRRIDPNRKRATIIEMFKAGHTPAAIMTATTYSLAYIYRVLKAEGLEVRLYRKQRLRKTLRIV
jgi:hypothetical protein